VEEARKLGLLEIATVTGRARRAALFNIKLAKRAIMLNSATQIALTRLDTLFKEDYCVKEWQRLSLNSRRWVEELENELRVPIVLISTGEDIICTIDRRRELGLGWKQ
ncbi:MAG: adenylosuccinate synthetase, partial [Ignisphaera sp.]